MSRLRTFITLLLLALCCKHAPADEPKFVVAGYLPDYRVSEWSKETGPVTDLILFGMSAPASGVFDSSAIPKQHIATVRGVKANSKFSLLFTVGGWKKSEGFAVLAGDSQLRTKFIHDAREFCRQNGFDGIDYDWEHPEGADQIKAFGELLAETHSEFAKHGLIVTIAQAGWQSLGTKAYQSVDRVHLMAYDHDFPQATAPADLRSANGKATDEASRLIDDFSHGWQDWYTLSANNPHHWEYSTRKLNDPKWQGQPDQKLALEVQAENENELVIVLTENFFRSYRGKSKEFVAVVKLNGGKPETVSLTPDNFTTTTGEKLSSWKNVDLLSLRAYYEKNGTLLGSKSWQGPQPKFRKSYWQRKDE